MESKEEAIKQLAIRKAQNVVTAL